MLKRLWILLSIAWDILALLLIRDSPTTTLAAVTLFAFPWLAGIVLWLSWRFVRYGFADLHRLVQWLSGWSQMTRARVICISLVALVLVAYIWPNFLTVVEMLFAPVLVAVVIWKVIAGRRRSRSQSIQRY